MDRIELPGTPSQDGTRLEALIDREQSARQRITKSLFGYGGILVSLMLCVIVVLVVTTDISLSTSSIAELSTDFFLLLFCSYASYICCSDSGAKAGKLSVNYITTINKFNEIYQGIIDKKIHCILGDFCKDYIASELKNAKTYYLVSAGVDYAEYASKYANLEKDDIEGLSGLSTAQKKAIMSANAVKPIKLYPEQITRHGGVSVRRSPLLFSPNLAMYSNYVIKFITIIVISIGMSLMVLNEITTASWSVVVMIFVKLGTVVYNCFSGYKAGYENIVINHVQFMEKQISLMQQAIIYAQNAERVKTNESESQHNCPDSSRAESNNQQSEFHGRSESNL